MYQTYQSDLSFQETVNSLQQQHEYRAEDRFILIRGDQCASRQALFAVFRKALDFPDYFADNWDSFSDCLFDFFMRAESNILIHISDFAALLGDDSEQRQIFQEILDDLGENEYSKRITIVCSSHPAAD